jgi:uncharacterized membrane protein
MTLNPAKVLRSLALVALMAAWAITAYLGSTGQISPDANTAVGAAPLVFILAMLLWRLRHPLGVAAGGLLVAGTLARIVNDGGLSARQLRYTRQATQAWALFFLANATLSSLLYVLAPHAVWSFYASLLTAPLVGLMFVAEHLWRMRALPREERPSLAEVARVWRQRTSVKGS